jgi:hypothetical protein
MAFVAPIINEVYPPATPTGLAAVATAVPLRVYLTWQDNASDERGFRIERAPVSIAGVVGSFEPLIPDLAANQAGGVDTGVVAETRYA